MNENFAIVICYAPQGSNRMKSIFGKVGPFDDSEASEKWCYAFREIVRKQNLDMTAIASTDIEQMKGKIQKLNFLPSRDTEEIIRHATVSTLFGIPA